MSDTPARPAPAGTTKAPTRAPYTPPQVTSRPLFERMALACSYSDPENPTPS